MSTMVEFQTRRREELRLWALGYRVGLDAPGVGMFPAVLPIAPSPPVKCATCGGMKSATGAVACRKCGSFVLAES